MQPARASALLLLVTVLAAPVSGTSSGSWTIESVAELNGVRWEYTVFVPSSYNQSTNSYPLVLMLHGCGDTRAGFQNITQMNVTAEANNFIAVYPEHPTTINAHQSGTPKKCWKWFLASEQDRSGTEPSLLVKIVNNVSSPTGHNLRINLSARYVAGLSAGAAMANVLGATYPDVFAAVGAHSGYEYNATQCQSEDASCDAQLTLLTTSQRPRPGNTTGHEAFLEMGSRARAIRSVVFQGDTDALVPVPNANNTTVSWTQVADFVDDGVDNDSVSWDWATHRRYTPPPLDTRHEYDVYCYTGAAAESKLAETWIIHGMGHAWSGTNTDPVWTDPNGPPASDHIWRFFNRGTSGCT